MRRCSAAARRMRRCSAGTWHARRCGAAAWHVRGAYMVLIAIRTNLIANRITL